MNSSNLTDHDEHEEGEHSWKEEAWPILVILVPLCIIRFLSNVVVVWIFAKWRILRDRINLFVANLAVSNLAICVVAIPLIALPISLAHTAQTHAQEIVVDLIYRISACLFCAACYSNAFATTAIALHRRRMILKPRVQMKREKPQKTICIAMWTTAFVLSLPELFRCAASSEGHGDRVDSTLPTLLGHRKRLCVEVFRVTVQFLLVSALMIFSYVSVFLALRKRSIIRSSFCSQMSIASDKKKKRPMDIYLSTLIKAGGTPCEQVRRASVDLLSAAGPTSTAGLTVSSGNAIGRSSSAKPDLTLPSMKSSTSSTNTIWRSSGKMQLILKSLTAKTFSASDSKNVFILIATIAVHFLCWSPYNAVRLYFAIVEAVNDTYEPRAPMAESIVMLVAVSSILHCPIFYTWFNRRNRHGLFACCAAVIPCRNSLLRQRLKEMVLKGNSARYRLPIPIDTPPNRSRRRASKLQSRFQLSFMSHYSHKSVVDELRQVLRSAQQDIQSSSPPPTRHNTLDSAKPRQHISFSSSSESEGSLSNTYPNWAPVATRPSAKPRLSLLLNRPALPLNVMIHNDMTDHRNSTIGTILPDSQLQHVIVELAHRISSPTQNTQKSFSNHSVSSGSTLANQELFNFLQGSCHSISKPLELDEESTLNSCRFLPQSKSYNLESELLASHHQPLRDTLSSHVIRFKTYAAGAEIIVETTSLKNKTVRVSSIGSSIHT